MDYFNRKKPSSYLIMVINVEIENLDEERIMMLKASLLLWSINDF